MRNATEALSVLLKKVFLITTPQRPPTLRISVAYQEMLTCLEGFDETDRTILAMLGAGHSYIEIQEVVSNISMANLRVKANRARIQLANCIGRKL